MTTNSQQPPTATPPSASKPDAKPKAPPIPAWAWPFAVLCAASMIVTLGGAIPGVLAFCGAGLCIQIARSPTTPLPSRIAGCTAVTLACWGILIAVRIAFAGLGS